MKVVLQAGPNGELHLTCLTEELSFARFYKMLETGRHVVIDIESFEEYQA